MNREIKFRAWTGEQMFYEGWNKMSFIDKETIFRYDRVMQYTGLKDKNGKEIYDGDIVKRVRLEIEYQTHYGDNIPLGVYTEPIGVISKYELGVVRFIDGEFTIIDPEEEQTYNWLRYPEQKDRSDINYIFFPHYDNTRSQKYTDAEFTEAMGYVCEDMGVKTPSSIDEFIAMVNGVEVVGNIYETPELLNNEQNDERSVATGDDSSNQS